MILKLIIHRRKHLIIAEIEESLLVNLPWKAVVPGAGSIKKLRLLTPTGWLTTETTRQFFGPTAFQFALSRIRTGGCAWPGENTIQCFVQISYLLRRSTNDVSPSPGKFWFRRPASWVNFWRSGKKPVVFWLLLHRLKSYEAACTQCWRFQWPTILLYEAIQWVPLPPPAAKHLGEKLIIIWQPSLCTNSTIKP